MLVGERMSHPVITMRADMPIIDALNMMKREHVRRTPILKDGKLVGIISEKDLLNATPSAATTLSVWEMNYLLSKITVSEVMTQNVLTVTEDTPIEEAARIMADNKVGGLPVLRGDEIVGIISETDLFKIMLEMMGARERGVRVTIMVHDKPGGLAEITQAIAGAGGNFISFGTFLGDTPTKGLITFKVEGIDQAKVKEILAPMVEKLVDIRYC
jgi:acetoin utilization protein AcuB